MLFYDHIQMETSQIEKRCRAELHQLKYSGRARLRMVSFGSQQPSLTKLLVEHLNLLIGNILKEN